MHIEIEPAIHYWGTPVVLVSTLNDDGSTNIAPMSSAWWLGWSCMLGFDASSKTVSNLRRERECVVNLASLESAGFVDRLARTTGASAVPLHKQLLGYRYVAKKAEHAGVTLLPSVAVRTPSGARMLGPPRSERGGEHDPRLSVPCCSVELKIVKVHAEEALLAAKDRVDPQRWDPLLMSFRELFVRGPAAVQPSRLAVGDETAYAPWKRSGLVALAGKGLRAYSQLRYGVDDESDDPLATNG